MNLFAARCIWYRHVIPATKPFCPLLAHRRGKRIVFLFALTFALTSVSLHYGCRHGLCSFTRSIRTVLLHGTQVINGVPTPQSVSPLPIIHRPCLCAWTRLAVLRQTCSATPTRAALAGTRASGRWGPASSLFASVFLHTSTRALRSETLTSFIHADLFAAVVVSDPLLQLRFSTCVSRAIGFCRLLGLVGSPIRPERPR